MIFFARATLFYIACCSVQPVLLAVVIEDIFSLVYR